LSKKRKTFSAKFKQKKRLNLIAKNGSHNFLADFARGDGSKSGKCIEIFSQISLQKNSESSAKALDFCAFPLQKFMNNKFHMATTREKKKS
jgi:hypothetical protein